MFSLLASKRGLFLRSQISFQTNEVKRLVARELLDLELFFLFEGQLTKGLRDEMRLNMLWTNQGEFMSINMQIKEQVNVSQTCGFISRTGTVHTFLTVMSSAIRIAWYVF